MKSPVLVAALVISPILAVAAPAASPAAAPADLANPAEAPGLQTEDQKTLYALGVALGRNVSVFSLNGDELKIVTMGLKDTVLGKTPQVDLNAYGPKVNGMASLRMAARAEAQKKNEKSYIDKSAKAKGAKVLPSGLIYLELKAGKGSSPTPADTVKAHYRGTLTDGKVFDSSYERAEPTQFQVGSVIPCWTEALQKMKPGGKAKLVCPSDIGYGDRGNGPIPGGATLTFEVELVEVVKK